MSRRQDVKRAEARIRAADAAVFEALAGATHRKVAGPPAVKPAREPVSGFAGQKPSRTATSDAPPFVRHTMERLHQHLNHQQLKGKGGTPSEVHRETSKTRLQTDLNTQQCPTLSASYLY
jgi:hypothetical protein